MFIIIIIIIILFILLLLIIIDRFDGSHVVLFAIVLSCSAACASVQSSLAHGPQSFANLFNELYHATPFWCSLGFGQCE